MDAQVHGHEDDINAVAFADASSHILFSGGDDGLCKVCQPLIGSILHNTCLPLHYKNYCELKNT